jgi:hypothetical protein
MQVSLCQLSFQLCPIFIPQGIRQRTHLKLQYEIRSRKKENGRRDVTVLLNNAMTVARRPLTQLGYISVAISRFSSVPGVTVKQSVFKKQLYERVVT